MFDGSPNSEPAIAAAFEEASLRGVDLVAVHAWSDFSLLTVAPADLSDNELPWSAIATAEQAVLSESLAGWKDKYPDVSVPKLSSEIDRFTTCFSKHGNRSWW